MTDPDMGHWTYGYDTLGNLSSQTDARGTLLSFEYDALNRMTKKWQGAAGTGTQLAGYTYDSTAGGNKGIGRRTGMTFGTGLADSESWAYNALGQVTGQGWTISSASYSLSSTYDAFSRILSQTYPGGEVLAYTYNAMGALDKLHSNTYSLDYVKDLTYNERGQVTAVTLGNDVTTLNGYGSTTTRLVTAVSSKIPANPVLSLSYQYDRAGNITQLGDLTRSETTAYTYDSLDRLKTATAAAAAGSSATPYQRSYEYDQVGNITRVGTAPNAAGGSATNSGAFGGASLMGDTPSPLAPLPRSGRGERGPSMALNPNISPKSSWF